MSAGGGSPRSPSSGSPGAGSPGSSPRPRGGGGPIQDDDFRATVRLVRNDLRYHVVALAFAALLGLLLTWIHWFGLVLGGAFVGYVSPSLRRAVVAGFGFGVLVLVVFGLSLGDSASRFLEMTPVVYVTVASALILPVFGSLVRGLER